MEKYISKLLRVVKRRYVFDTERYRYHAGGCTGTRSGLPAKIPLVWKNLFCNTRGHLAERANVNDRLDHHLQTPINPQYESAYRQTLHLI